MSFAEILVTLLVALIVLGPKQLPVIAYQLGRYVEKFKYYCNILKQNYDQEMKQLELQQNIERAKAAELQAAKQDSQKN